MSKRAVTICEKTIIPATTRERLLPLTTRAGLKLVRQGILMGGISEAGPGFVVGRIDSPFHVLLFTIGGEGLLVTEKGQRRLRRGDLIVAPAGRSNHVHMTYDDRWTCLFVRLDDTDLWSELRLDAIVVSPRHNVDDIATAMDRYMTESVSGRGDSAVFTNLYADLILAYLEREIGFLGSHREREVRERLDRLWDRVNSDLGHEWSVDGLAGIACMSKSHFTRMCVRFYKVTPMQMVQRLRMTRAQILLVRTDWPVYRIAEMLGYSNQFAFSVAFSRETGGSPTDCRRQRAP